MNIELDSATISFDEGDNFWVADFTLQKNVDASPFFVGFVFPFDVGGEAYTFMVHEINVTKQANDDETVDVTTVVKAKSPSAILTAPFAAPVTKTWGETTALDIATELFGGYAFTWSILNWPITDGLFSANEQYPLDIVRNLVEAVGATVVSDIDGSIEVRYIFPISVVDFNDTTASHTIVEATDAFATSNGLVATVVVNKLRIGSSLTDDDASSQRDYMDFEAGASGVGTLRVYPAPWRTDFSVSTTHSGASVGTQVYAERTETQTLEVVEGKFNVSFPILSINSLTYGTQDLGAGTFTVGGTEVKVSGQYSMVTISYQVRSLNYAISGPVDTQVQFLMESP